MKRLLVPTALTLVESGTITYPSSPGGEDSGWAVAGADGPGNPAQGSNSRTVVWSAGVSMLMSDPNAIQPFQPCGLMLGMTSKTLGFTYLKISNNGGPTQIFGAGAAQVFNANGYKYWAFNYGYPFAGPVLSYGGGSATYSIYV